MDVTIGLRSQSGCLVTAAQSFNNHGPIQGMYRFIGEEDTFLFAKGELTDHEGKEIPLPAGGGGVDDQDGEFFAAIGEGRFLVVCGRRRADLCQYVLLLRGRLRESLKAQALLYRD